MELQVDDIGGTVSCVRLSGRLDAPGADRIGVRFTAAATVPGHHAVIDLSGVGFVASMGIRLLIATARSTRARGSMFVMFGAQELVKTVLTDAAIDQIIPLFDTEAEALKSVGGR